MVACARLRFAVTASMFLVMLTATAAFADKASVTLSVPDTVKKGTEVTIKIKVTHSADNFMHHVDWAKISVDGKEITRWAFSWTNTPESKIFEREFKYVVNDPVQVSAEADCNIHGSKGPAKATIAVTE